MKLAVNFRLVCHLCGWTALSMAVVLLVPIIPALFMADDSWPAFLKSSLSTALLAALMIVQGRRLTRENEVRTRDGLATVGLAWVMIGLIGSLPYWFSGCFPSLWDGLFESFSGFSTTGATVAAKIEELPSSILFWRALSHWLGGMGIIVLVLAVLPFFGLSGVQLFKNESTLGQQKLKPRIAQTAKILWLIYLGLTLILLVLLLCGGLDWFDAVCHTFSTIATGGFSNKNLSIGHYESSYVETVVTVFMIISSINFALYYQAAMGDWKSLVKNTECRTFLLIILIAGALIALSLFGRDYYDSSAQVLRHSYFQVVSVLSTTGLSTYDWEQWPFLAQGVLLLLFFVGGCSGSTSGGIKCIRWVLLFKGIHRTLRQHIHPRAVLPVRLGGKAVPEQMMTAVWSFGAIYFIVLFATSLLLASMDIDVLTAFSASASTLGNVGIGLGEVGPSDSYGHLPGAAKGILCFNMFLGRLEFFSLLILFLPEFWKK